MLRRQNQNREWSSVVFTSRHQACVSLHTWAARLGGTQIPGETCQPSCLAPLIWAVLTGSGPDHVYLACHSLRKESGSELLALGTGLCVDSFHSVTTGLLPSGLQTNVNPMEWQDEVHVGTREFRVTGSLEIRAITALKLHFRMLPICRAGQLSNPGLSHLASRRRNTCKKKKLGLLVSLAPVRWTQRCGWVESYSGWSTLV